MSQTDSLSWLVGSLVKILPTRRGSTEKGALQTSSEYVGTGFVLDYNGLLLTCAHVIEAVAIGNAADTVKYVVQFPALLDRRESSTTLRQAKLIKRVEAGIDLCLLQLEGPLPDGIWPVRLAAKQPNEGTGFVTCGYAPVKKPMPARSPAYAYARGQLGKLVPTDDGKGKLRMLTGASGLVPGFSGAPIAHEDSEAVIGVFTIVHTGEPDNHCMIPLDDVRRFLLPTTFVDVLPPPGSGEIEDATDRRLHTELLTLFTLMMKISVDDRREFFKRLSALSWDEQQALISAYAQENMSASRRDAALQSPAELQFIFALLKDQLPAEHQPQALHGSWLVLRDLIRLKHERLRIGALRATHGLPSLLEALSQTLTMLLEQSPKEAIPCETARAAVETIVWLSELILRRPLAEESTKQLRGWLTDAHQLAERCDGGHWSQEVLLSLSQLYKALGRYDDALSCIELVLTNQVARTSIDQALRALSQQPAKSADVLARAQGLLTKYTAARAPGDLNPRLLQAIAGLALTLADVLASEGRAKSADDLYHASREVFAELDDRQGEGQCWLGLALNNAAQEAARPVASFLNRARALFYVCGDELGRARTVSAALDLRGVEELHHVMVLECQELIARLAHVPDATYKQIAAEARISLVSWLVHRAESLGSTTESHPFLIKATEHLEKLTGETEFLQRHPALAAACLQLQAEVLALEERWPPVLATTEQLVKDESISGAAQQRAHSLRARAYLAIAKSEGSRSPEQLLELYFNALQEMNHCDSADWQLGRLRAGEVLLDKCDAIADARALARACTLPEVLTALKNSMNRLRGA